MLITVKENQVSGVQQSCGVFVEKVSLGRGTRAGEIWLNVISISSCPNVMECRDFCNKDFKNIYFY